LAGIIDNYHSTKDELYKFINSLYKKFPDLDYFDIFINIFNEAFDELESNSKWTLRSNSYNMKEYVLSAIERESPSINIESSEIDTLLKYYKVYILLYSLSNDTYDASSVLYNFVEIYNRGDTRILNNRIPGYGDDALFLARQVIRYGADDQIRYELRDKMDEFSSKNNIDGYSFRNYVRKQVWDDIRDLDSVDIKNLSKFVI
jgi:hypothetical protein